MGGGTTPSGFILSQDRGARKPEAIFIRPHHSPSKAFVKCLLLRPKRLRRPLSLPEEQQAPSHLQKDLILSMSLSPRLAQCLAHGKHVVQHLTESQGTFGHVVRGGRKISYQHACSRAFMGHQLLSAQTLSRKPSF